MEKSSDKSHIDFAFKILKKEKHLKLEINEVTLSNVDIISMLLKIVQSNEKKITKLENELAEFRKGKTPNIKTSSEENKKVVDDSFKISNLKNRKQIDIYNSETYS